MTDKAMVAYARSFRRGILGKTWKSRAMCFAISCPLVTLLNMQGLGVELVRGEIGDWEHFWIALPDGRIIDPTADQFDAAMPEVYLGERPANYLTEVPASP